MLQVDVALDKLQVGEGKYHLLPLQLFLSQFSIIMLQLSESLLVLSFDEWIFDRFRCVVLKWEVFWDEVLVLLGLHS
jgi:hypothetical protein